MQGTGWQGTEQSSAHTAPIRLKIERSLQGQSASLCRWHRQDVRNQHPHSCSMTGIKGEQDTYFILSASVKGSCTGKKTAVRFF